MKRFVHQETGSIAPLAIGLSGILLATTATFVDVGSLLLFQQRQTQQAEALALAAAGDAGQVEGQQPNQQMLEDSARRFAAEAAIRGDFEISTKDGRTIEAKVCGEFLAPIAIPFIALSDARKVCGLAKARLL